MHTCIIHYGPSMLMTRLPTSSPRDTTNRGRTSSPRGTTPSQRQRHNTFPQAQPESTPVQRQRLSSSSRGKYSPVPETEAQLLISTLLSSSIFAEKRNAYVLKQRSSRESGKADVVNIDECFEVAGEKSLIFEDTVMQLGIFDEENGEDPFVMYTKVPRTTSESKFNLTQDNRFERLTYLFSRWMRIDSDAVKLMKQTSPHKAFQVYRSVKYFNHCGICCEMFVIVSKFNRHLFHKEFLDTIPK